MTPKIFVYAIAVIVLLVGTIVRAEPESTLYITSVAWSPSGSRIAVGGGYYPSYRGYLSIFNVQTGAIEYVFEPQPGAFSSISWSPNEQFLAAGGFDSFIWVFDVVNQTHLHTLYGHSSTVTAVDWNHDGRLLLSTGSWDTKTILWDMTTFSQMRLVEDGGWFPYTGSFSPDGERIAIGGEAGIRIYSTSGVDGLETAFFPTLNVGSLQWRADGEQIAFGTYTNNSATNPDFINRAELYVFEPNSGTILTRIATGEEQINSLDWNRWANAIVTHSNNGRVNIWDLVTTTRLNSFASSSGYGAASFSPYGGRIAYSTGLEVTQQSRTSSGELIGIQIVVPDPTFERLNAIAQGCDGAALFDQPITKAALPALVAQIESLPADAIPPACRADLLAVLEALRSQP